MALPPLILCPLAHEAALLRRAATALTSVQVTGPGPAAGACVEGLARPGQLVVLVGTAGGLRTPWHAGRAALACSVSSEHATANREASGGATQLHPSPLAQRLVLRHGLPGASVLTVAQPAFDPAEKARLAMGRDADLVDCESFHVVLAAQARGCPWLIVRGVSDGPDEALPRQAGTWIDQRGRTRLARVCGDIARRPVLIAALPGLARASRAAMRAAGSLVEEALRWLADPEAPLEADRRHIAHAGSEPRSTERPLEFDR